LTDKEPVESWIKQARAQQAMVRRQREAVADISQKLEERKLIDRAKGQLMKRHGLDEEAAFKALRSSAMQHGVSLGELSRRLLLQLSA
jgi:two-component system, response regulator / RNA-binding antiterminator